MFLAVILSLSQAASPSAQSSEFPAEELVSRHYGLRQDDRGELVLRAIGDGSRERRLGTERPLFGVGEGVALLSPSRSGEQAVRLLDGELAVRAEFTIQVRETLVLGTDGLIVHRRSDHSAGAAFELEFRDSLGVLRGSYEESERVLLEVVALEDGGWAALSVDKQGAHGVHRFDQGGRLLWSTDEGINSLPIVKASPLDGRTAIGTLADDMLHSQLELRAAAGEVLARVEVPAFRHLAFAPDGETLALLGRSTLSLVSAEGSLLWSRKVRTPFLLGPSMAFASDGQSLRALVGSAGENPRPAAMLDFELTRGTPRNRRLLEGAGEGLPVVLSVFEDDSGRWQLATPRGMRSLDF